MSRALPAGMSPTCGMSTTTTSPSSISARRWTRVAPTLPAPTTVIFFLMMVSLNRDVPVLLLERLDFLVLEEMEGADDLAAGLRGLDDLVDVAALRGLIGRGEPGRVVVDELLSTGLGIRSLLDVALKQNVDGALGAHHGDLGAGPGVVEVAADVLGAHDVVGAAVRLAQDDRHLGHRGLAVRVEQLGAAADDAAVLLLHAGPVAGHVHQGQQRDAEGVADAH